MEFIEYYRIIRRRFWIALVMAGITVAVVIAARLMPQETTYPAAGRILVHEIAKREVRLAGDELAIGQAQDEGAFWNDFSQFVGSTQVLQTAAADIGVTADEAARQLQAARAERLADSNVAQVVAGATGVPRQPMAADVSNASDLAVRFCDAVMEKLDELWRARRVAWLDLTRETVEERLPIIEDEIARTEKEADRLIAKYEGVSPVGVLGSLTAELAAIEEQTATTEVSRGGAEARSEVLSRAGEEEGTALARAGATTTSPRVVALRQAILERQIQLDEQLSRRTAEHEEVKALQASIERLQRRLDEVEAGGEPEMGPEASAILQEAAVSAEVEAEAMTRRLELLRKRVGEIRDRLPTVRADARVYEDIDGRLTGAKQTQATLRDHVARLDLEEEQVKKAPLLEVVTAAEPQRVARGVVRFIIQLAVALGAGAGLGILLIFVLHYVDFSFQDEEEAERMLGVPVLAGIPRTDVQLAGPPGAPPSGEPTGEHIELR
jgi:capsular polysaccharide biosynthesis protein